MDYDVLVIGAGVLGLSSAYHLKRQNPEKKIMVIDRLSGPGQGNTAKSAGGFRNVLASEKNYLLADSTIDWFFHLQNDLRYDIKLAQIGYLWLLSESRHRKLRHVFDKMLGWGIKPKVFEKGELRSLIPDVVTDLSEDEMMGLESIDVGVMGIKCGTVDTDALARTYESEFLKLGGEVRYNTTATELILRPKNELDIPGEPFVWQDINVTGAKTNRGDIQAETTVVAAGVWSESLLDPIGFDSMMRPKKRVMFVFRDPRLQGLLDVKGFNPHNTIPLTHLPSAGVYMKPDLTEGSIWLACADSFGRRFGLEDDPQPERELYSNNVYHALVRYLPCFKDVRPVNMWAGQRAVNSYDTIPVVAPAPGMIYVGAATGNGILKCDALGRIAAALYADEEEAELFGGRLFRVSDIGIDSRNIERETFKV
ncbi:MAG: FAD-binding oxidoreductase [Candidatus Bathyarchaeota archaeon]|nr:FAD-binding oxidoreductase [Candidatus Bathyarchaeota archaeon]